ncbi:MAG: PAS domain S-box protein, partial [Sphingomonadales bacterium]|nr:PAS domain S-box protein [Sphingomonadales bacterium]
MTNPDVASAVERITRFTTQTAAIVDRGPEALRAALPALRLSTAARAEHVRTVSLQGLREFTEEAKLQRERVFLALVRLALLTTALLGVLTAGLIALWWLWRFGMRQARSLRAAKARLEAVIGTALDAVIVIDQDGRVTEFNPASERIFGYQRDEAIGRRLADLIVPRAQAAAHERGFRRYLETGEARIVGRGLISLEARRRDGSKFPVELSVSTTRIGKRQVFVSYLRDITDRVSAERELIEARDRAMQGERAKAAFVAVMSHEMRTPLNGLLGTLDLLRETPLNTEQGRFVQAMEQAGQILLQHVNDVLDVERLDAGKLSFQRTAFDPAALAAQLIEAQRDAAAARGNRMELETLGALPGALEGDPIRIRQVLLNLIGNAVKFTTQGLVRVEIEYHAAAAELEFRVIDTGVGISPEDAERIFEDFVTLDPAQSREHTGSGLGLGIARRIIQAMGGRIGVESEPNEGSVFW